MSISLNVWYITPQSRIFHSYGDVTITGEGLQILTYALHSWSSSSEGSFACHTNCDAGHPFIMVISDDPWHSHLLSSIKHQLLSFVKLFILSQLLNMAHVSIILISWIINKNAEFFKSYFPNSLYNLHFRNKLVEITQFELTGVILTNGFLIINVN